MTTKIVEFQTLHKLQYQLYDDMKRWNCWVCHRRFGKTVLCLQILLTKACSNELLNPRYAYVAPLYKQAKAAAWDYLRELARYIPGTRFWENELRCRLGHNNAEIKLLGADNPDALRGIYLDGVVLDEYAQMRERVWTEVIRPTLSDEVRQADGNQWAIFIGTPYGRNQFYDLHVLAQRKPEWSSAIFRASETGVISEAELAAAREQMSEDEYDQEYECSWVASIPGAYYAEEFRRIDEEERIREVPYDPALPVYTAWDLGINDVNAIWFFQPTPTETRFIDYEEGSSRALVYPGDPRRDGWVDVVRNRSYVYDHSALNPPLTKEVYEVHYGPHDLENRSYQTGKTAYGVARENGLRFTVLPRGDLQDGIAAARKLLAHAVFDSERCALGIEALRGYRREWDDGKKAYRNHPLHDWSSNGADAFRYAAVGIQGPPRPRKEQPGQYSFEWWAKQAARMRVK